MTRRWDPGDQIVLREVWQGKVWSGRPLTVVRDEPDLLVVFQPAGTRWQRPVTLDGGTLRMPKEEWMLVETRHPHDTLVLATPGADHSVRLFRAEGHEEFFGWYVNLEQPYARTPIGLDSMDQALDIVISPDLSEWHWKDEDELEEEQALGLISNARARELRAEGERVIELMQKRSPPFDGSWEGWRPDPAWPVPELPDGWDIVG